MLLEAMASGLAIVATGGSAIAEVVGDAAVIVAPRDPAALLAAMRRSYPTRPLGSPWRARCRHGRKRCSVGRALAEGPSRSTRKPSSSLGHVSRSNGDSLGRRLDHALVNALHILRNPTPAQLLEDEPAAAEHHPRNLGIVA